MAGRDEETEISSGSCISDSESVSSRHVIENLGSAGNGLMKLMEQDEENVTLKHQFYSIIGSAAKHCTVVATHKNMHCAGSARARLEAFQLYSEAMGEKRAGNPNIKNAWYGASKVDIIQIVRDGFDLCGGTSENSGLLYGRGVYLSAGTSAIDSVVSSIVDEDGLRHVLLCRVILGNTEEVIPPSNQSHPSSDDFDSGVDGQKSPKKYIIWPEKVKTHILPMYVLSIKLDFHSKGVEPAVRRPSSPWIPLTKLISMLQGHLSPHIVCLIKRYHNFYMERKITRQQLIFRVRLLSGDKLLISAIKAFRDKQMRTAVISAMKK